jgi:hypothetical protein
VCKLWSKKFAVEGGGTLADTYFDGDRWMCPKCDPCYKKRAAKRAVKLVGKEEKKQQEVVEEEEEEEEFEEEEDATPTATKSTLRRQGRKARPSSGYYGVYMNGKRWRAKTNYGGKSHYLGNFGTKQEAALAYDKEARKRGGDEKKALNYSTIEEAEEAAVQARVEYGPTRERARAASGYYGVGADRKRWKAAISYGGERHYLGSFDTKQEAALAYDKEVRKRGGGNQMLNYDTIEEAEEAAAQARVEYGPVRQRARPASGYYGVCADGKRWKATVNYGGKRHYLGNFDTKQEAALAYDKEARKRGGEKKALNYDTIEEAEEAAAKAQTAYAGGRRRGPMQSSQY